jgi:hypothetical protein
MEHEYAGINHEFSRLYDPWETFTHRDENKHRLEDTARLCSPLTTCHDIINICFSYESRRLDDPIPRRSQILRDFLEEVLDSYTRSNQPYGVDIDRRNNDDHIVLVDDRQNHLNCEKKIRRPCAACQIFSKNLTIPQLRGHLTQEVSQPTPCTSPVEGTSY